MFSLTQENFAERDSGVVFPEGFIQNDPDFTALSIGEEGFGNSVCPKSDADWVRLGKLIGDNTHLTKLNLSCADTERCESYEEMLRGLAKNRSLNELSVSPQELLVGSICRILSSFFEGNHRLKIFRFSTGTPALGLRGEMHALSTIFAGGTNISLWELDLSYCSMDEDMAEEIISSLARLSHLEELDLTANNIGRKGCAVLSELLRGNTTLRVVSLGSNGIGDEEAEILVEGLSENKVLTKMILSNGHPQQGGDRNKISDRGWNSFTRILCNKSNAGDTCQSNHTLNCITHPHSVLYARMFDGFRYNGFAKPLPPELATFLSMNENVDKRSVARQKILMNFTVEDAILDDLLSNVTA